MIAERGVEPWRRRLYLPAYTVSDAARFSRVAPQTVTNWTHRQLSSGPAALSGRSAREHLSYLELVEVAVVAVFRQLGVSLEAISRTRRYMQTTFSAEFPFSAYQFKTDGMRLMLQWTEYEEAPLLNEVIVADVGGQLGWENLMATRLAEFDYEHDIALVWHLAGRDSPVKIDPRLSFGAPTVSGVPTWVLKGRWNAGESLDDIVDDFGIPESDAVCALRFEGLPA